MNEIIVLGAPGSPFKKIAIFELDTKSIRERDSRNPQLVLEYAPGIYFSRNSRNEYSFRLRGFEQRQISVFLDGIPISIPFDGMVDLSQLIGQDYSKMRISKGVSSILYGANSLGGTLDILSGEAEGDGEGDVAGVGLVEGEAEGGETEEAGAGRFHKRVL